MCCKELLLYLVVLYNIFHLLISSLLGIQFKVILLQSNTVTHQLKFEPSLNPFFSWMVTPVLFYVLVAASPELFLLLSKQVLQFTVK